MANEEVIIENPGQETQPVTPVSVDDNILSDIFSKGMYSDNPGIVDNVNNPVDPPPAEVVKEEVEKVITTPEPTGTPTEEIKPAETTTEPQTYTQEDISRIRGEIEVEIAKKYENLSTLITGLQTNPYETLSKVAPHLFQSFDQVGFVNGKLSEEFGEFTPDPSKSHIFGTEDYKYIERRDQLIAEARNYVNNAQSTLSQNETQTMQQLEEYKATKAKALGIDLNTFNSKIWAKVESMEGNSALDTIIEAIVAKEKLEGIKTNINKAIDTSSIPISPAVAGASGSPAKDNDMELIYKTFGHPD